MGLPDLHLYLKTVDSVVPLVIPVMELPKRCLGFVPRDEPLTEDGTSPKAEDLLILDLPQKATKAAAIQPSLIP